MNHAPPKPYWRITSPFELTDAQITQIEHGLQKEYGAEYLYIGEEKPEPTNIRTDKTMVVTIFERNWRKDIHHV